MDFHHFVSALPVVQVRIFFRQKMSRRLVVGSLVLFSRKKEACCSVMLWHASFFDPVRGMGADRNLRLYHGFRRVSVPVRGTGCDIKEG